MEPAYRWVIVGMGALMTCVGIGAMFSLAVYLEPMSAATGWSRTGISSAMTLDFLVMGVAGFAWGAASDRFGTSIVVLFGAVLLGLALVLASRATTLIQFQLTYGVLVGLAAGSFFAPMIAAATLWFDNNRPRGLAGLRRHGRGAHDRVPLRSVADLNLRLAHGHGDGRHCGLDPAHPRRPARAPAARCGFGHDPSKSGATGGPWRWHVRGPSAALAAVRRAGAHLLSVLRGPFR